MNATAVRARVRTLADEPPIKVVRKDRKVRLEVVGLVLLLDPDHAVALADWLVDAAEDHQ